MLTIIMHVMVKMFDVMMIGLHVHTHHSASSTGWLAEHPDTDQVRAYADLNNTTDRYLVTAIRMDIVAPISRGSKKFI